MGKDVGREQAPRRSGMPAQRKFRSGAVLVHGLHYSCPSYTELVSGSAPRLVQPSCSNRLMQSGTIRHVSESCPAFMPVESSAASPRREK
jgi:hypothetical protein